MLEGLLNNFVLFLKLQSLFKVGKSGSELVLSLRAFSAKEKSFTVIGLNFEDLVQELNGLIKLLNAQVARATPQIAFADDAEDSWLRHL